MEREDAPHRELCVRCQFDVGIEHQVVMRVSTVHDQVVRAAIAYIGVTVQIIHGHAGVLEPSFAERDDCFGSRSRSGIVDEHDVGNAQPARVLHGPQGDYVYRVTGGVAKVAPVTVALSDGDNTGLNAGVEPGDTVVIDGQDKLQNLAKVEARTGRAGPIGAGRRNGPSATGPMTPSPESVAPGPGAAKPRAKEPDSHEPGGGDQQR